MQNDCLFLRKTFKLALKGEGRTSPNPLVGAVIVKKDRILATGYHKKAGSAHAEIDALEKIKGRARGAVLYVNLEPCCIWGKTPPCVDRIIASGIKKVVISNFDPNPAVNGRSVEKMRAAGLKVETGLLSEQGRSLNEVFFKNMEKQLPFVAVKSAFSLDGKTVTAGGESQWITGEKARFYGRKLRDKYDAVGAGINTVLKDDPVLEGSKKKMIKVILDPHLKLPVSARLFDKAEGRVIIVASNASASIKKKRAVLEKKAVLIFVPENRSGLDLIAMLKIFYKRGINSLYIEGGSATSGSFFDCGCVDKFYFFIAPMILGGSKALPVLGGRGIERIKDAVNIRDMKVRKIGSDLLIEGYPEYRV